MDALAEENAMKSATLCPGLTFLGSVVVLMAWLSAFPPSAAGQGQGNNAVYYQSGSTGVCCKGSSAFIDASTFTSLTKTFCSTIYGILQVATSADFIDARGLNSSNTQMTCAAGWTPWNNGSTFLNVPSTILLPAGTIVIPTTWVLPNNTTLIGVGDSISPTTGTGLAAVGTIIQLCTTTNSCGRAFSGTDMIDFGSSVLCAPMCNSVSVENLTLDGQGQTINGIVNSNSQTGSYVDHVSLYQILGTGLLAESNANNSGPYSNITFDTGGSSGLASTVCAQILGLSGTRGIHGLSCNSETNDALAAVLLDSSNNSVEDVRIVGFYDGIRVGANANAQSNVLVNIIGDTNPTGVEGNTPIIVVHITNSVNTVTDLSIMGANNAGGNSGTITIKDDLTGAQLVDTSVGVYALGKKSNNGYSRFTTSPNAATWGVGSSAPGTSSCSPGSLYSNTSGNPKALYVCLVSTSQWSGIR